MKKPKTLNNNRFILEAYESCGHKHIEVNISKHDRELTPTQLRRIGKWMLDAAEWLDGKKEFISMDKFKEIAIDPMRMLFENLRYETDKDILLEIVKEIEETIVADMRADEMTELNLFEYLAIVDDVYAKFWRNDIIDEMIDRYNNPKPEEKEIVARRLIYDYMNLPDDDTRIVEAAIENLSNKKDIKMLEEYVELYDSGKKPCLDGMGEILMKLKRKYPLML